MDETRKYLLGKVKSHLDKMLFTPNVDPSQEDIMLGALEGFKRDIYYILEDERLGLFVDRVLTLVSVGRFLPEIKQKIREDESYCDEYINQLEKVAMETIPNVLIDDSLLEQESRKVFVLIKGHVNKSLEIQKRNAH